MTAVRRPNLRSSSVIVIIALMSIAFRPSTEGAWGTEMTALRSLVHPGEQAPPFTLNDLDGKTFQYKPGYGKPSLIVFWSAFCPLCRELTPAVNDIARRHGAMIRLVSVNLDGKRFTHAVQSFVKETGIRYPVLLDNLRDDFFVASDPYGVEKTPTAVLVDASGKVHSACAAESMREMFMNIDEVITTLKKGLPDKKK